MVWTHCDSCFRFSDISGKADEKIFAKNYSFLDGYRQDEIKELSGVMKKLKSAPKKAELKGELVRWDLLQWLASFQSYCL